MASGASFHSTENRNFLTSYLADQLPQVVVPEIEATYLAWIDCTALPHENPSKVAEEKEKLFLADGAFYGVSRCLRFNFGCSTQRVQEGLEKMVRALRA